VVVDHPGAKLKDLTAKAPAFVAEVLSPSTTTIDLGDKAAEYLQLPSLVTYLVLAQDEVKAWAYVRGSHRFPAPQVVEGVNETISIPVLAVELPLADIYSGLDFD